MQQEKKRKYIPVDFKNTECFSSSGAGSGMQDCLNISLVSHRTSKGQELYGIWNREASESHTPDLCVHFQHIHPV